MASPFQKISFYVALVLIVGTLSFSLFTFGNDLTNSPNDYVNLDNKSTTYIDSYQEYYNSSGYKDFAEVNRDTYSDDSIIVGGNSTSVPQTDGFLATVQYAQTFVSKIFKTVYLVYNTPIFILQGLGIPITPFTAIANIISGVIFLAVVVMFIKLINIGGGDV